MDVRGPRPAHHIVIVLSQRCATAADLVEQLNVAAVGQSFEPIKLEAVEIREKIVRR
jgi:hypothetical protein